MISPTVDDRSIYTPVSSSYNIFPFVRQILMSGLSEVSLRIDFCIYPPFSLFVFDIFSSISVFVRTRYYRLLY